MRSTTYPDTEIDTRGTKRVPLCLKLLHRIFDPECGIGEAENSASKMIGIARRDGIGFVQLCQGLALVSPQRLQPPQRPRERKPLACHVRMTQGKYFEKRLLWLAKHDWEYLVWVSQEWREPTLRDAAAVVVDYVKGGAR